MSATRRLGRLPTVVFTGSPVIHMPVPADRCIAPNAPATVVRAVCGAIGITTVRKRPTYDCPHCRATVGAKLTRKQRDKLAKGDAG